MNFGHLLKFFPKVAQPDECSCVPYGDRTSTFLRQHESYRRLKVGANEERNNDSWLKPQESGRAS